MKISIFILSALFVLSTQATARPIYAIKLGKRCEYCHVNPKGGGVRNPRGIYFGEHGHTFKDYDEEKVMGQYKPKLLHRAWTETFPKSVLKFGVADTAGDGSVRLVLL